jgi:hypothetical protein
MIGGATGARKVPKGSHKMYVYAHCAVTIQLIFSVTFVVVNAQTIAALRQKQWMENLHVGACSRSAWNDHVYAQ